MSPNDPLRPYHYLVSYQYLSRDGGHIAGTASIGLAHRWGWDDTEAVHGQLCLRLADDMEPETGVAITGVFPLDSAALDTA